LMSSQTDAIILGIADIGIKAHFHYFLFGQHNFAARFGYCC
jgi:hypothetical protein